MPVARRIVLASHAPWLGGAERCVLELAQDLSGVPGREVAVLLPGRGPLEAHLRAAAVRSVVAPARWWARDPAEGRPRLDPAGALRAARALRSWEPDVVVSSSLVHPAAALAAAALRLPHVWWVHELGDRDHGLRFALGTERTRRTVGRLSRAVLAPSRTVAETLGPRAAVMPYAVDGVPAVDRVRAPRAPRAGETARLVVVGRVRPSKGHEDAVRALGALRRAGRRAALRCVGDGTPGDVAALRALARREGVEDRLDLPGGRVSVTAELDRADLVLVPSHEEAFGRVTVEALKRGRPVVGARSGGTAELLEDGRTGLLHRPRDAQDLARVVARALDDPALRASLARDGHAWATATFTRERQRRAWLDVLDAVTSTRGA